MPDLPALIDAIREKPDDAARCKQVLGLGPYDVLRIGAGH